MAPTHSTQSQWKSLLFTSLTVLALSPLSTSLPLPASPQESPASAQTGSLQARSPDPRMIPSNTDFLSVAFASLGMEELDKLNKLDPEDSEKEKELQEEKEENNTGAPIDDSQSSEPTVTAHRDEVYNAQEEKEKQGQTPAPSSEPTPTLTPTPTPTPTPSAEATPASEAGEESKNSDGFMDDLFEALRSKFREALNGADEMHLR